MAGSVAQRYLKLGLRLERRREASLARVRDLLEAKG
jgi:hypothetical protein